MYPESESIPVPAETLRVLADAAEEAAKIQREKGRTGNASGLEGAAERAREAAAGKDGEFVSFNDIDLSSMTAFAGSSDVSNVRKHIDVGAHYLEQYDYW